MTYDQWKTTDPRDSEPECWWCGASMRRDAGRLWCEPCADDDEARERQFYEQSGEPIVMENP